VRCIGFDQATDIANTLWGANTGIDTAGDSVPVIDSSVKASGNGSLKFTIPSNSSANSSGTYWANFSPDLKTQFGANSEFYVQWRQRFSPELLSTIYQRVGGGNAGGWKLASITTGDQPGCTTSTMAGCFASCTAIDVPVQNTEQRGFAQMYHSCTGSASHGPYDGFNEPYAGDYKLQNARPAPYCLYTQGPNFFPPNGNCFRFFANEWMTFQMRFRVGPRVNDEFVNSYIELWVAREGQASEQVINWGPYNLSAGTVAEDQKYGKVYLLPYHSYKDPNQTTPTAYTWYDELIISTSRIPDPGGSVPPPSTTQPPAAPTGLTLK